MLQIGWVDFSKEHRSKVLNVLSLLTTKGAVDELGVGVARDRLADILFPGTSTIQTRAKYFLLVPWIMRELEKQQLKPNDFLRHLNKKEVDMIDVLKEPGQSGIIGEVSGEKLKRKPSEIYWNGLKTYGIFRYRGLTIMQYIQIAGKLAKEKALRKQMPSSEEGVSEDTLLSPSTDYLGPAWLVLEPPDNWQNELSVRLSREEADFLRKRTITAPGSKNSLWAEILRKFASKETLKFKNFDALDVLVEEMPDAIKTEYRLARDFARIIYGAHIRYNHIFFRGREKESVCRDLELAWKSWLEDMRQISFNKWDEEYLFKRLALRDSKTRKFIKDWINIARNPYQFNIEDIDQMIIWREKVIKGSDRAKIVQSREWSHVDDRNWIGIGKLQYRWPNARVLLKDIVEGWGDL